MKCMYKSVHSFYLMLKMLTSTIESLFNITKCGFNFP